MANVAVGAMLFGQFLDGRPFSLILGGVGLVVWIGLVALAIAIAERTGS